MILQCKIEQNEEALVSNLSISFPTILPGIYAFHSSNQSMSLISRPSLTDHTRALSLDDRGSVPAPTKRKSRHKKMPITAGK